MEKNVAIAALVVICFSLAGLDYHYRHLTVESEISLSYSRKAGDDLRREIATLKSEPAQTVEVPGKETVKIVTVPMPSKEKIVYKCTETAFLNILERKVYKHQIDLSKFP